MKKLLALLGVGALVAAGLKMARACQDAEWRDLTETQARSKLEANIPSRVPADKRNEIADKVIAKMRERGLIQGDAAADDEASPAEETIDLREGAAQIG